MIQTILPKCFLTLNDCLSRILRENGVVRAEEKQSDDRTQLIVKTVLDMQNRYLSEKPQERQEIRAIIKSMKPDIEQSIGGHMSAEVDRVISIIAGMADDLDSNFRNIYERLDKLESNVIGAI